MSETAVTPAGYGLLMIEIWRGEEARRRVVVASIDSNGEVRERDGAYDGPAIGRVDAAGVVFRGVGFREFEVGHVESRGEVMLGVGGQASLVARVEADGTVRSTAWRNEDVLGWVDAGERRNHAGAALALLLVEKGGPPSASPSVLPELASAAGALAYEGLQAFASRRRQRRALRGVDLKAKATKLQAAERLLVSDPDRAQLAANEVAEELGALDMSSDEIATALRALQLRAHGVMLRSGKSEVDGVGLLHDVREFRVGLPIGSPLLREVLGNELNVAAALEIPAEIEATAEAFMRSFPDDPTNDELRRLIREVVETDAPNASAVEKASEAVKQAIIRDHQIAGRQLEELASVREPEASTEAVRRWLRETVELQDRHVEELVASEREIRDSIDTLRGAAARLGSGTLRDMATTMLVEADAMAVRQRQNLESKLSSAERLRAKLDELDRKTT